MKLWKCLQCGFVYKGASPPGTCPMCGASPEKFDEIIRVQKLSCINQHKSIIVSPIDKRRKINIPHPYYFKNVGNDPASFLSVKQPKPVNLVMLEGE